MREVAARALLGLFNGAYELKNSPKSEFFKVFHYKKFIYRLTIVKFMQETMPQEIEVRYILPAIRREFTRIFIEEHGLIQKKAAKILGLTEAAVSQYQNSKRAKDVVFSNSVIEQIKTSALRILAEKDNRQRVVAEIYRISNLTKVRHILCDIHRAQSKELEKCNICFDDNEELLKIKL